MTSPAKGADGRDGTSEESELAWGMAGHGKGAAGEAKTKQPS